MTTDRLIVFDTTLRDGEQAPGFSLRTEQKLRLARQLAALGVDVMEVGFPVASEDDARAVELIAREVRGPVLAALGRCNVADIELVGEVIRGAERPRIHTFIATSDLHMEAKLRISRDECLRAVQTCVARARDYTDDVQFSAEDATRSDMDFLCQVVDTAIAAGATTINLPDTVGYSVPSEVSRFFREVMARTNDADGVVFSTHCHDDLGLAVANSLAAVLAGVRQVECTINGIGERAGNASLEEIVMATRVRRDLLPFATGIDTTRLFRTSRLLCELTGEPVQANKAIVGRNAFAHEAGIHQHGMIRDRRTYEIMRPEDVGVESKLVLGKHSGRHAVKRRCEGLGYNLTRFEVDRVYREVIALADQGKSVGDDDLVVIVNRR
ncbi:MAG: 2-isopropylmalate synthase [Gemmatimonadetes bacterium]|nr:2-isopropylmalate synthase [Gemmatimonadota bacterium]MXX35734.1 2-isopropylmalate synthase [Gemmatimonadota bacterium]MYA09994.1 2-isopropylmalate synthase [Gemmatimonadota bacterium]MYD12799.1 2-isopropylmalate synthase [Gemmatimonadota bacterium]MYE69256.1 2-isopropylmalate synthase [Gemmatimonadota bacterium]